jgi:Rieske Fe-S protein
VLLHPERGFPIVVYRLNATEYSALLMKCTHQGQELNANGDQLSCPAHGSEFDNRGRVLEGPAEAPLTSYKTRIENGQIYIQMA